MKKRLVFCFDGSWNKLTADHPTNVVLTAESVRPTAKDGSAQVIFYDEGVGTAQWEKFRGGLMGYGLMKNLADAYRFLIFNHTSGDDIFVFGFSRGAFSARSFVGLINNCGIIERPKAHLVDRAVELYENRDDSDHFKEEMLKFRSECSSSICVSDEEDEWRQKNIPAYDSSAMSRLQIRYLGVWDTVGALGIPEYLFDGVGLNEKYAFHNTDLSEFVHSARHAVAIDEPKADFRPTLWNNLDELNRRAGTVITDDDAPYQEKWFPGVHGSVGGGGDRRGLSDQALEWIWDGARHAGLELDTSPSSRIYELMPSHKEHLENASEEPDFDFIGLAMRILPTKDRHPGPKGLHEVSMSARRRWHEPAENLPDGKQYRPKSLESVSAELDALDPTTLGVGAQAVTLPAGSYTVYEIRKGDSLRALAKERYGDANQSTQIVEANRDKIHDPDLIYAGQVIRIPN